MRTHGASKTLVGLAAVVVALTLPAATAAQGVGPALGTAAPAAALEDLDGNPVQLLDYVEPGKPTILEFWASWCEQCEALQPELDAVRTRFGDEVTIVAVAVAVAQSVRRVKRHLERHDPGYLFLWDAGGEAVRAYKAPTTAVIVILDGHGKVAYAGVGPEQDLQGEVAKLLGD